MFVNFVFNGGLVCKILNFFDFKDYVIKDIVFGVIFVFSMLNMVFFVRDVIKKN